MHIWVGVITVTASWIVSVTIEVGCALVYDTIAVVIDAIGGIFGLSREDIGISITAVAWQTAITAGIWVIAIAIPVIICPHGAFINGPIAVLVNEVILFRHPRIDQWILVITVTRTDGESVII
jgi:hypothetical protein